MLPALARSVCCVGGCTCTLQRTTVGGHTTLPEKEGDWLLLAELWNQGSL